MGGDKRWNHTTKGASFQLSRTVNEFVIFLWRRKFLKKKKIDDGSPGGAMHGKCPACQTSISEFFGRFLKDEEEYGSFRSLTERFPDFRHFAFVAAGRPFAGAAAAADEAADEELAHTQSRSFPARMTFFPISIRFSQTASLVNFWFCLAYSTSQFCGSLKKKSN